MLQKHNSAKILTHHNIFAMLIAQAGLCLSPECCTEQGCYVQDKFFSEKSVVVEQGLKESAKFHPILSDQVYVGPDRTVGLAE